MSSTLQSSVQTGHADMVHDAQFDFYGRRLATCSSDRVVKVFDAAGADGSQFAQTGEIAAHEGPVWAVAWAHPQFGALLASCGYDRRVLVHREVAPGQWLRVHAWEGHGSSVNAVAWAPHEYGLQLACASSDGSVSVLTHRDDDSWAVARFADCAVGCNGVSWAPAAHVGGTAPDELSGGAVYVKRLAVAASDSRVRLYKTAAPAPGQLEERWVRDAELLAADGSSPHREWVRDVAFSPASGVGANTLASCSDDCTVAVWTQQSAAGPWALQALPRFEAPVWRVSWSVSGHLLAVSCGDNAVTLWKQSVEGLWAQISAVPDPTRAS